MARIKRALSVDDLTRKKFIDIPLSPEFKKLLGTPSREGSWMIWGPSGSGKTTFTLQLAKELAKHNKVEYLSLEEGAGRSMKEAVEGTRMHECRRGYFKILDGFTMDDIKTRLSRKRAAKIIIINSVQYTFINKLEYFKLKKEHPNTLFIWISHAKGKEPLGATAQAIRYDADIKIRVEGYRAFSDSRLSRGIITKHYDIWPEAAKQYWELL